MKKGIQTRFFFIALALFIMTTVSGMNTLSAGEPYPTLESQSTEEAVILLTDGTDFGSLSDEQWHAKANALITLTLHGTEDTAAVIAPYLATEQLNTHACTALMNLPGDSGRAALRQALDTLSGPCQTGVIQSLGQLKDEASREKLSALATSDNADIAAAATHALKKLDESPAPNATLTAPTEPTKPEAEQKVEPDLTALLQKPLTDDADILLLQQWSQTGVPSAANILTLFANRISRGDQVPASLDEALSLLCYRTNEPAAVVEKFNTQWPDYSVNEKCLCLNCLALVGNAALPLLEKAAFEQDDAVVDAATRILGEWLSLDAAPVLLKIAKEHSTNKYRVRAARGYLRLVRQMDASPDEKRALADTIAPLLARAEEKELLTQLYQQIEATRTDKLIFDGTTFQGWEGDTEKTFRIEDGVIVAGSATENNPRNEFLCTTSRYRDFTLTLECKVIGEGGNAGIQFRSERIPDHFEMIGYQADMTADGVYWGRLYDEQRRQKFLVETDPELIKKVWKPNDWNRYKIVCWGPHIKLYLNDVLTVDYQETDPGIPLDGVIGLQIHGGNPSQSFYRNIRLENYIQRRAE